jgi:hypothetical protein
MPDKTIRIDVELPPAEALALAQFVKRVTWTEMRACAADEAECYEIRAAITRYSARWPRLTTRRGKSTARRPHT